MVEVAEDYGFMRSVFLESGEVPRDEGVRGVEKRGCDDEMVQDGFGRKG